MSATRKLAVGLMGIALGASLTPGPAGAAPAPDGERPKVARAYRDFARPQAGAPAWWTSARDDDWNPPEFPRVCSQADAAHGGDAASAWQVLWLYPEDEAPTYAAQLADVRAAARVVQSIYAASAQRYVRAQNAVFARSLAPRFLTDPSTCEAAVTAVPVPPAIYHRGRPAGQGMFDPFGQGDILGWLMHAGFNAPNRKYVALMQSSPAYPHVWKGISENLAAGAGGKLVPDERPDLDNEANYTSYSFLDLGLMSPAPGPRSKRPSDLALTMAHEMAHALGAMSPSAPHRNTSTAPGSTGPLHPTDCWDLLCYGHYAPGQTYSGECGRKGDAISLPAWRMRLDCGRDDYFAPATDSGLPEAAWANSRWAVHRSSFLYGNPQPTAEQLAAHQRSPKVSFPPVTTPPFAAVSDPAVGQRRVGKKSRALRDPARRSHHRTR